MYESFKGAFIKRFDQFRIKMLSLIEKSSILPSVNINSPIVLLGASNPWGKLDHEGKRLQHELYKEYLQLKEIAKTILEYALPEVQKEYEHETKSILEMIEQSQYSWFESIKKAKVELENSHRNIINCLESVHGKISDSNVLIPDTNIFIKKPNLHEFKLKGKIHVVLMPSILEELDRLKNEHKNDKVRTKANTAIRNIKEYRRRGNISEGVKINETITLSTVAIEPKFDNKPKWLDPNNNDDRFLASCFELAAKYPDSTLAILTSDINLQNKADISLFPYLDPDENEI